jgi:hypothetical protein
MPEITVYKHCQLSGPKDNIRIPRKLFDMFPEPITPPMQFRPEIAFRFRVLAPDPGHAVTALLYCEVIRNDNNPFPEGYN